mmetsp:Transcript_24798/g.61063  ORF Transcript_24798/g.61063 Transcript_24798/m.61063 type:complete len:228 (+) Transcript_24798:2128-2811(+)
MADDPLDAVVGGVRGAVRSGQHQPGVEQVKALVLHGAHVEVVHRHDVEQVQVVLEPEGVLVPLHGALEGRHGEVAAPDVLLLGVDAQLHRLAAHGGERVRDARQVARHQREQVAGLAPRVLPHRHVPPARKVAGRHQVAVGQQHGVLGLVRADLGGEDGHDVRPVGVVRDEPEPLGLALRAEVAAGLVQPAQLQVVLGLELGHHAQGEASTGGGRRDGQPRVLGVLC